MEVTEVLRVDQVHVIRHKRFVEGVPIRRIAREMGMSRNTVRKYLVEPEPVRKPTASRRRPVFEKVEPRMASLLEEWSTRTTRKQRITAARVHEQLVAEGYEVGLTLVQDYLRERRRRAAEVYVPLVHRPGDEAQVDFFEVTVEVAGVRRKAWMFVMRMMYSGRDFAWLYDWADQVCFLDGHVSAFEHFGAVPQRIIYDNLKPAVRRMVAPERELTARFAALAAHYVFEPCFARPGTGHDKGGVEARGKGIRLQHLVPIPRGASLSEISSEMLGRIDRRAQTKRDHDGRTVADRFAEEQPRMLPLMGPRFEPARTVPCTVSRSALVKVAGAVYSVPSAWKSLDATAYLGANAVRIVCRGEQVCYERQRFGGKVVRYRHYLDELSRKPQALRQVAPELLAELGEPYGRFWRLLVDVYGPREAARVFARVIGAVVEHGQDPVTDALEAALASDRTDLLELAVALKTRPVTVNVPAALAGHQIEAACAADYDELLGGGGR
ncbi:MAG: IS21 family transposase [Deltaproteobacteria bacterium]|nr:MAG: IS21 family transposase [Deltaproteobacteria bacterium]